MPLVKQGRLPPTCSSRRRRPRSCRRRRDPGHGRTVSRRPGGVCCVAPAAGCVCRNNRTSMISCPISSSRRGPRWCSRLPRRPAYSQARLLRERTAMTASCVPPASAARQFVFMSRAGFDASSEEGRRRRRLRRDHEALFVFYQAARDGRVTRSTVGMQLRHSETPASEHRSHQTGALPQGALPTADALDRGVCAPLARRSDRSALQTVGREQLALVSSFGTSPPRCSR